MKATVQDINTASSTIELVQKIASDLGRSPKEIVVALDEWDEFTEDAEAAQFNAGLLLGRAQGFRVMPSELVRSAMKVVGIRSIRREPDRPIPKSILDAFRRRRFLE